MCKRIPKNYGKCVFCEGDWHVVGREPGHSTDYWFWHVHPEQSYNMPWLIGYFRPREDNEGCAWLCCKCKEAPPEKLIVVYNMLEFEYCSEKMAEVMGSVK